MAEPSCRVLVVSHLEVDPLALEHRAERIECASLLELRMLPPHRTDGGADDRLARTCVEGPTHWTYPPAASRGNAGDVPRRKVTSTISTRRRIRPARREDRSNTRASGASSVPQPGQSIDAPPVLTRREALSMLKAHGLRAVRGWGDRRLPRVAGAPLLCPYLTSILARCQQEAFKSLLVRKTCCRIVEHGDSGSRAR